ncbi:MAG: diaminopimelate decarboxylase, partial [Tomitella sp.]|nr:diaminopimelate decarboxylase [Tomitella sp.]
MNAHPAGEGHADLPHAPGLAERPAAPAEMMDIPSAVWPRGCTRGDDGVVRMAGVPVTELAAEYGTPLFVIDEDDFRGRCRDMAAAFGGPANVNYASKAFLSVEIARWVADEGLSLDVASGGELAV